MTLRRIAGALIAAMLGAVPLSGCGQGATRAYPSEPIKLIVPFTAGGTTDLIARLVAAKMSEDLGQQVVVENRDGSGGTIGTSSVAHARPDGYTLVFHSVSSGAINYTLYKNLDYDGRKDFAPISLVTRAANLIIVRKDFPANTLAEFVTYAKANPGKINYGSSGNGTVLHLSAAVFAKRAGIEMVHIPYRGGGPAMNDLLAGVIDMMFENMPTGIVQIRPGNVKALGVTTLKRSPLLPELPTIAEQGYPGFETDTWSAMLAPAGTPPEIIARLNQSVVKALADPEVKKRLEDLGCDVIGSTPEELGVFVDQQIKFYGDVVKDAGVTIE